jgi:hypothetical protein
MAKMRTKRLAALQAKRAARKNKAANPGGESKYARKRKYLVKNGGFGFQYPEPKPWR